MEKFDIGTPLASCTILAAAIHMLCLKTLVIPLHSNTHTRALNIRGALAHGLILSNRTLKLFDNEWHS